MLFHHLLEYSSTGNQEPTNEMATATMMNPDQFDWNHHQCETVNPNEEEEEEATTTTYDGGDYEDQEEPAFNKAASNRATTSNAERRYQRRSPPPRTTPAISAPTTNTVNVADVKPAHECVQKPKTRAERRAVEPEQVEAPAEVLPAKRERRSDYWVQRDDERRNAARTFKTQTQQVLSEGEEEDLPW